MTNPLRLIINFKNYSDASGERTIELAKTAEQIAGKYKMRIAVAPPRSKLAEAVKYSSSVLAQYPDVSGYYTPEYLNNIGVSGSLINHSDHRIPKYEVSNLVERLEKLNMISIVCVKDAAEAGNYAKMRPSYIAVEPPDLIGGNRAVSRAMPDVVAEAVGLVRRASNGHTEVLCGAAIKNGEDASESLDLGATGVLVHSAIMKARDWRHVIGDIASGLNRKA